MAANEPSALAGRAESIRIELRLKSENAPAVEDSLTFIGDHWWYLLNSGVALGSLTVGLTVLRLNEASRLKVLVETEKLMLDKRKVALEIEKIEEELIEIRKQAQQRLEPESLSSLHLIQELAEARVAIRQLPQRRLIGGTLVAIAPMLFFSSLWTDGTRQRSKSIAQQAYAQRGQIEALTASNEELAHKRELDKREIFAYTKEAEALRADMRTTKLKAQESDDRTVKTTDANTQLQKELSLLQHQVAGKVASNSTKSWYRDGEKYRVLDFKYRHLIDGFGTTAKASPPPLNDSTSPKHTTATPMFLLAQRVKLLNETELHHVCAELKISIADGERPQEALLKWAQMAKVDDVQRAIHIIDVMSPEKPVEKLRSGQHR